MPTFRARRPITSDRKFEGPPASATGDFRPPVLATRPPPPQFGAGRVIAPAHAPLPTEYAPPPPRVASAPARPGFGGSVVAGGSYPGAVPPVPVQAPALVRAADRPGPGGAVIRLGFAPPEEPSPRPAAHTARAADCYQSGAVTAAGSRAGDDAVPPPTARIAGDGGRSGDAAGAWAGRARARSGPGGGGGRPGPQPPDTDPPWRHRSPGGGSVLAAPSWAQVPAGGVIASGSYEFGLPPGLYLPAVRVACEAPRPGFAGRVVASSAAPDAVTPDPDPIFQWYTNAAVRLRSRRGKT